MAHCMGLKNYISGVSITNSIYCVVTAIRHHPVDPVILLGVRCAGVDYLIGSSGVVVVPKQEIKREVKVMNGIDKYHFQGDLNLSVINQDMMEDGRTCYMIISKDITVVGILRGYGTDVPESYKELNVSFPYKIFMVDKKEIPDIMKFIKKTNRIIRKMMKSIKFIIKDDKKDSKNSNGYKSTVFTY